MGHHYKVKRANPTAGLIAVSKSLKPWGFLVLAVAAIGILVNLKDIRRYIRISTM
jgi:hypothetical protein